MKQLRGVPGAEFDEAGVGPLDDGWLGYTRRWPCLPPWSLPTASAPPGSLYAPFFSSSFLWRGFLGCQLSVILFAAAPLEALTANFAPPHSRMKHWEYTLPYVICQYPPGDTITKAPGGAPGCMSQAYFRRLAPRAYSTDSGLS